MIGVFNTESTEPDAYDETDQRFLEMVASQLAAALHSTDLLEEIQANEAKYRRIVETANEGIWVIDAGGMTTFVNKRMAEMLGYGTSEMLGTSLFDFMDDEGRFIASANIEWRQQNISEQYEIKFRRKDGGERWCLLGTNPIIDNAGGYEGALAMVTDITERRRSQQALRESELRFRRAMENIPDIVVLYDQDLRIQYINSATQRITGRPVADFIGKREEEIWPPEVYETYLPTLKKAFETGQTHAIETELHLPGDKVRTLVITCVPLTDDSGTVHEVMGITHDLTERKQMEDTIRESELRFRQIAETIHEVFFLRDANKHSMLYVSPAYNDIWGRPRENLYQDSSSFLDTIHLDDRAQMIARMELQREGQSVEAVYRIIRPDRKIRWIRSQAFPVFDTHGTLRRIAEVASDITDRVRYENQLKRLSQRLVTVLDNERARIARELHDQVGQQLTGLGINLSVVAMQCTQDNQAVPLLKESTELTSQIIERIRFIIADLRPFVLDDMGLAAGLGWYCQSFAQRTGTVVHFNEAVDSTRLSPETNNTLYQIAQETLTNIAKHPRPRRSGSRWSEPETSSE